MRRRASTTVIATTLIALPAAAQTLPGTAPAPPGQVAPGATNPRDTPQVTPVVAPTQVPVVPAPAVAPTPAPAGTLPGAGTVGSPVLTGPASTPAPRAAAQAPSGPLVDALAPRPGGLTAEGAVQRALASHYGVQAAEANVAAARGQQAEVGRQMIPSVTTTFRYTRLSEYTVDPLVQALFPPILDQYAVRISVVVPLSDIPLRLLRLYEAAGLTAEARRLDVEVARAQAALQAREAYYEYLRALGQAAVAQQGLETATRRRGDLQRAFEAGTVARAEVLRADAAVADIARLADLARNGLALAEAQLRQRLRMTAGEPLAPGEALDATPQAPPSATELVQRALAQRPELVSVERQLRALDLNVAATRATQLPSVAAVGNFDVMNPNTRFLPVQPRFRETWDVTLQVSWSPTAAFVADATVARLQAQRAQVVAQLQQAREGLELEVRSIWTGVQTALAQIEAARAALASAEENLRVVRERLGVGAATQSEVAEGESGLLRARLGVVNAQVDLRIALARLRRAVGEREPTAARR